MKKIKSIIIILLIILFSSMLGGDKYNCEYKMTNKINKVEKKKVKKRKSNICIITNNFNKGDKFGIEYLMDMEVCTSGDYKTTMEILTNQEINVVDINENYINLKIRINDIHLDVNNNENIVNVNCNNDQYKDFYNLISEKELEVVVGIKTKSVNVSNLHEFGEDIPFEIENIQKCIWEGVLQFEGSQINNDGSITLGDMANIFGFQIVNKVDINRLSNTIEEKVIEKNKDKYSINLNISNDQVDDYTYNLNLNSDINLRKGIASSIDADWNVNNNETNIVVNTKIKIL